MKISLQLIGKMTFISLLLLSTDVNAVCSLGGHVVSCQREKGQVTATQQPVESAPTEKAAAEEAEQEASAESVADIPCAKKAA